MSRIASPEIARCRREIAAIEAQILAGHPDLEGLCRALADWSAELRILESDPARCREIRQKRFSGDV